MSSRSSRRSGANANTLNVATIQLLDRNRLIKELSERGLDTTGSKNVLSDRLYDFIVNGTIPEKPAVEKTPTSTKKAKKSPVVTQKRRSSVKGKQNLPKPNAEEESTPDLPTGIIDIVDDEPDLLLLSSDSSKKIKDEVPEVSTNYKDKSDSDNNTKSADIKIEPVCPEDKSPCSNKEVLEPRGDGILTESEAPVDETSSRVSVDSQTEEKPNTLGKREKRLKRAKIENNTATFKHVKMERHDSFESEKSDDSSSDAKHVNKRLRESSDISEKAEPTVKRQKASITTTASSQPEIASWKKKWAEKLEAFKKDPSAPTISPRSTISEQSKGNEKQEVVKRKESGEKIEVPKKKETPIEKIDSIAALISSTLVKPKQEVVEASIKKDRISDIARARGGSDASKEYSHGLLQSVSSEIKPGLSHPSTSRSSDRTSSMLAPSTSDLPPPPPPPKVPQVSANDQVPPPPMIPRRSHPAQYPMFPVAQTPYMGTGAFVALPPPPPPLVQPYRRKSRFDQPPQDYPNVPAPTLATSISIAKRESPPPPPPPRNSVLPRDSDVPPPPPPSSLKERIALLFSSSDSSEKEITKKDESCSAQPTISNDSVKEVASVSVKKEEIFQKEADVALDEIPTPDEVPQCSENLAEVKIPEDTTTEESKNVEDEPDDDDDDFVIRDTFVETAPEITKIRISAAERRKSMIVDEEGEYDPLENTIVEDSSILDYVPSCLENAEIGETDDNVEYDMNENDDGEYIENEEEENESEAEEMVEESKEAGNDDAETLKESKNNHENAKEEGDADVEFGSLLTKHNARDLLKLALPVLESLSREKENESTDQYCQMIEESTSDATQNKEPETQEEVYYHGDPVPEVDENELFEIAAGIKPAKKKEKKNIVQIPEEERLPSTDTVELDYYNADIHVKSAENNIWQIEPFSQDGLALMWGGVRSNFGISFPFSSITEHSKKSKLGFQIEIDAFQKIQHLPTEFLNEPGDVRVGFSLQSSPLILGEYSGSWCISASGKKATNNHFYDFGSTFDVGDIITCIFDFENLNICYKKNDEDVNIVYRNISLKEGDVLFPTICVKNANVNVNLGQDLTDEKWKLSNDRDWMFITDIETSRLVKTRVAPESKSACTVLMTVGLPAVGKTTWVRRYLAEHPNENWNLISADVVMDTMRIDGVPRNRIPTLKRPDFLRGIIGKSMARLILLAPRRRKNYVLDMTNCIQEKRKRKLMAFEEFNRKCMIFVPDEDTHLKRLLKQEHEENEKLDTDALMQHKAAMSIPNAEVETFEELIFIDPPAPYEHLAYERVQKMNSECKSWLVNPGNRRRNGQNNFYHNTNNQQNNYNNLTISTNLYTNTMTSGSGPSSSIPTTSQTNSPSIRMINITHTTFQSSNGSTMSPKIVGDVNSPILSTFPSSSVAQQTPITNTVTFEETPTIIKADLTKPLMLNIGMNRISAEKSPMPTKLEAINEQSPRIVLHADTTVQPPPFFHQPPPQFGIPYPIDVKVPPPDFSTPPPPIPSLPPHLMAVRQPDQQPIQHIFPPPVSFPPPQFTPR